MVAHFYTSYPIYHANDMNREITMIDVGNKPSDETLEQDPNLFFA